MVAGGIVPSRPVTVATLAGPPRLGEEAEYVEAWSLHPLIVRRSMHNLSGVVIIFARRRKPPNGNDT